jgi:hypothetical protein
MEIIIEANHEDLKDVACLTLTGCSCAYYTPK